MSYSDIEKVSFDPIPGRREPINGDKPWHGWGTRIDGDGYLMQFGAFDENYDDAQMEFSGVVYELRWNAKYFRKRPEESAAASMQDPDGIAIEDRFDEIADALIDTEIDFSARDVVMARLTERQFKIFHWLLARGGEYGTIDPYNILVKYV